MEPPRSTFPPFHARPPWWTGDLQTMRNFAVRARWRSSTALRAWPVERLWIETADGSGDRLAAAIQTPGAEDVLERPVIVLVHGLGGNEESSYLQVAALDWLRAGHRVARLNLRGAGITRPVCRLQYDAGDPADLRTALVALSDRFPGASLALVGFSLGGSLALRLAGQGVAELPLLAVASVSAPLDLAETAERLAAPRNALYRRRMLHKVKQQTTAPGAALSPAERRAIERAKSLIEVDERFTAPRGGFRGAADYYEQSSARKSLSTIRTPALLVHAVDDPWIPAASHLEARATSPAAVRVLLAPGGGHVGFHGRGSTKPWHQICVERFFAAAAGSRHSPTYDDPSSTNRRTETTAKPHQITA